MRKEKKEGRNHVKLRGRHPGRDEALNDKTTAASLPGNKSIPGCLLNDHSPAWPWPAEGAQGLHSGLLLEKAKYRP